jgi:error-prone DNA polymerase
MCHEPTSRRYSITSSARASDPLPLFAAADARRGSLRPEVEEERVDLVPMAAGGEVVEDYRSRGLTLRSHPVAFLRGDLAAGGYMAAGNLGGVRDGRRVSVAGLVLVRQRPGSASSRSKMKPRSQT